MGRQEELRCTTQNRQTEVLDDDAQKQRKIELARANLVNQQTVQFSTGSQSMSLGGGGGGGGIEMTSKHPQSVLQSAAASTNFQQSGVTSATVTVIQSPQQHPSVAATPEQQQMMIQQQQQMLMQQMQQSQSINLPSSTLPTANAPPGAAVTYTRPDTLVVDRDIGVDVDKGAGSVTGMEV